MLSLLLGLTLTAPRDVRVDTLNFSGASMTITLRGSKHAVKLREILLDVVVPRGTHLLTEANPLQLPGPLLMVECSKQNELDGNVVVLGAKGLKVKGPKIYSVFALEPFANRFPGTRLRMVKDNGAAIFSATTVDVVQVAEDYRYFQVVGLDPTAKYRVKVTTRQHGPLQVLVISDRASATGEDLKPADAEWTASRMVLKRGMQAELPSTRQVAVTLAGVRGIPTASDAFEPVVEVSIVQVKMGRGLVEAVPTSDPDAQGEVRSRSTQFLVTVSRQLLQQRRPEGARPLLEQCVTQEPKNAECHLLYAQTWAAFGDKTTMMKHACLAFAYGGGEDVGDKARDLLAGDVTVCR